MSLVKSSCLACLSFSRFRPSPISLVMPFWISSDRFRNSSSSPGYLSLSWFWYYFFLLVLFLWGRVSLCNSPSCSRTSSCRRSGWLGTQRDLPAFVSQAGIKGLCHHCPAGASMLSTWARDEETGSITLASQQQKIKQAKTLRGKSTKTLLIMEYCLVHMLAQITQIWLYAHQAQS